MRREKRRRCVRRRAVTGFVGVTHTRTQAHAHAHLRDDFGTFVRKKTLVKRERRKKKNLLAWRGSWCCRWTEAASKTRSSRGRLYSASTSSVVQSWRTSPRVLPDDVVIAAPAAAPAERWCDAEETRSRRWSRSPMGEEGAAVAVAVAFDAAAPRRTAADDARENIVVVVVVVVLIRSCDARADECRDTRNGASPHRIAPPCPLPPPMMALHSKFPLMMSQGKATFRLPHHILLSLFYYSITANINLPYHTSTVALLGCRGTCTFRPGENRTGVLFIWHGLMQLSRTKMSSYVVQRDILPEKKS